jgi:aerobic carbon-monoxide dehydrogenase medium subunit
MIPAAFDYVAPDSLEEAVRHLHEGGADATVLAGGHSLLPLMKLRLAHPNLLVDLRNVPGLHGVQQDDGHYRIGAMTTHSVLEDNPELGLLSKAASTIADRQVRNRGTVGGSVAHGDTAADMPAVMLACEGEVTAQGPNGQRTIAAGDFFQEFLTTALEPDEILTELNVPTMEGWGFGYEKFNRRAEDWAMVAVCALVKKAGDGGCEDVRIGLTHMGPTPLRATAAEDALRGGGLDEEAIRAAAGQAGEGTDPPGDLNATPDYKRHLARVLTRRALTTAARG